MAGTSMSDCQMKEVEVLDEKKSFMDQNTGFTYV